MTHFPTTKAAEHFCVFQIGESLFAFAAAQLREVTLRPELANIPNSHKALAGLWHEGSEFLPVLRLPIQGPNASKDTERHLLVILGSQSTWSLLVDRVHGIEQLEPTASHTDSFCDDWSTAQIGTAEWNQQLVRLLNADAVYRRIEQILKQTWAAT